MLSNRDAQSALLGWLGEQRPTVAGTVTFRPSLGGRPLCSREARSAVSLFLRRLDRAAFGSRTRKGMRVGAVTVWEGQPGYAGKHLHCHLALVAPTGHSPEDWAAVAHATWLTLDWASPAQNVFKPTWSDQWLAYMLKDRDKTVYLDAMDYENWRLV